MFLEVSYSIKPHAAYLHIFTYNLNNLHYINIYYLLIYIYFTITYFRRLCIK